MNRYYQQQNERCGLLLPFIAGALIASPIAYLAGNNNNHECCYQPQPQNFQSYPQPYYQPVIYQQPYYPGYQQPIVQNYFPN